MVSESPVLVSVAADDADGGSEAAPPPPPPPPAAARDNASRIRMSALALTFALAAPIVTLEGSVKHASTASISVSVSARVCLFLFLFPVVSVLLLAMVGRDGCWTAAAGATTLEVLALPATAEGETDAETEPTGRRMASPTNKLMFDNAARSC